jgi:hypothetical protein
MEVEAGDETATLVRVATYTPNRTVSISCF